MRRGIRVSINSALIRLGDVKVEFLVFGLGVKGVMLLLVGFRNVVVFMRM